MTITNCTPWRRSTVPDCLSPSVQVGALAAAVQAGQLPRTLETGCDSCG